MPLAKSPGGSYFPYAYKGGELFGLHLGSFQTNEEGLIARMQAEERFFLDQHHCLGIWMDFYQSRLTVRVIAELITFLEHTQPLVSKLGLVGCSGRERWRINRALKRSAPLATLPVRYFSDPEEAKTWLVSEG